MNPADPRQSAARRAVLAPASKPIGPFTASRFTGGHMLICQELGLILATGKPELIGTMTPKQQTMELLTIGALMCHPRAELEDAMWGDVSLEEIRAKLISPILFELSPAQTTELLQYVTIFFSQSAALAVETEEKPTDTPDGPQPVGK